MNRFSSLLDGLHKTAVFGIVIFTMYATAETVVTMNTSIQNAKIRMEADKKVGEYLILMFILILLSTTGVVSSIKAQIKRNV